MTDMTDREVATVLAALRYWQTNTSEERDREHDPIATNCGTTDPLTDNEIDDLCERINSCDITWDITS